MSQEDVLPAVYSVPPAAAIAGVIERKYDLGGVATCRLMSRGNNDVYAVRLEDGRRVVARLNHRRARGASNTAFETALLAHLKAGRAPVAGAIPDREGGLWRMLRAAEGEREFAVFEHLPGAPPSTDPADARLYADALGRIHSAARDFSGVTSLYRHDLTSILTAPAERLAAVPHLRAAMRAEVETVAALAEARLSPLLDGLVWQVNHGDAAPVNCHIRDADGVRRAGFIDFEEAAPGWLAHELSHVLFHRTRLTEPGVYSDDLRREWSAFVGALTSVTALPSRDLEAVVAFLPVRWLYWATFYADRLDEWGTLNLQPAWLSRVLVKARRWLEADPPPL